MGALFRGTCYEVAGDAVNAFYGAVSPAVTAGSTSHLVVFNHTAGAWVASQYSGVPGAWVLDQTMAAPSVSFPSCNPAEGFQDGLAVGMGLLVVVILAWSYRLIQRQMR